VRPDSAIDFGSAGTAGGGMLSGRGGGGMAGAGSGSGGIGEGGTAGRGPRSGGGGAGTSGVGGAGASAQQLFPCIEDWPSRPPGGNERASSLPATPTTLWTNALPSSTGLGGIGRGMAITGTGVAFASGYTLLIYDGSGNLIASVSKPQPSGYVSSPVSGPDGSLFFADSIAAYRVDGVGKPIWQTPIGVNQVPGSGTPPQPALDPGDRLHISAMDGNLWTFRAESGEVLWNVSLGLLHNAPRYINVGFGRVLVLDRSGIAAAGPGTEAYGFMAADTGAWIGEVVGQGLFLMGGYDLGVLIARGTQTYDLSIYDKCGSFRWRVPGDYPVPLAITFDDDLIVMDRAPSGAGTYSFALRRFSKDGELRVGPVPISDQSCGSTFVGADDTFYYVGYLPSGPSAGYRLWAFDGSLNQKWVIPFPFCPEAAVLADSGRIFAARTGQLTAVQTTSPGPARVSWGQNGRDARATFWLGP
jgi:hypothetical protein